MHLRGALTPTNPQLKIVLIVEDYGLKGIIRKNKGRVRGGPAFIFLKLWYDYYWLF
jgi:hypothetical protein